MSIEELSEAQIDHIAERAADKALQKIYAEVGQNILKKMAWLVGLVVISLAMFLSGKGLLK